MKRVISAAILAPLVIAIVLKGPQWSFLLLMASIGSMAFWEFDTIAGAHGVARSRWLGLAGGLGLLLAPDPLIAWVTVLGLAFMAWALRLADLRQGLGSAAAALLGIVYIFGAWRCAILLRDLNPQWLMIALIVSWIGDTAAMYVGKTFGKHKLAPRVSPGKTWEGAIGSVVGGTAIGVIWALYFIEFANPVAVAAISAGANIAGQVGDLCESAFKRGAGMKDSGTTLPGHGGWLDRIDSSLFSIPVVYALVQWL